VSPKRDRRSSGESADDGHWLEPDALPPRLLLFAARPADLDAILATGAIAAVIVAGHAPAGDLEAARGCCSRHRTAFLLQGEAAEAAAVGADGVHLDDPQRVAAARTLLGRERLIGAACGRSRHAAMVAGEAGADYVLFGSPADAAAPDDELGQLVAWWSELFVLPCAAAGELTPADALALIEAGADLVAVDAGGDHTIELARALIA
jgi:thiamine-phosphate pyrophosphorylase